jgi:thiol-disulfide isomerase/thioredoxin
MAKKTLLPVIFLLLLTVLNRQGAIAIATEAKELARQAEEKLNQGSRLAGADKMAEATVCFQQAAELYEQAIQKDPNDKASRQNYLYCLGERGMIYIRKGQQSLKDKKYALAADCYSAAITAYDSALKKLPQEKNFQTNRRYCRHEWGLAQFQVKLAGKGPAYAFQLSGLDGSPVSLAGMKGRVVLLEFMAGWCPTCRDSLPMLQQMQKQLKAKGVLIVVLSLDRLADWKKSGSEEKSLTLMQGMDFTSAWTDEETFYQYGSFNSVPTVIIIDRAGKIIAQVPADGRDREQLLQRITALL